MTQNHSFTDTSQAANSAPSSKDLVTVPLKDLVLAPWVPVISMTVANQPANPTEGDTYLVPVNATGSQWELYVGQLVQWHNNEWNAKQPAPGHGISLPDGRIFELVNGSYVEKIALDVQSGKWVYAEDTSTVVNRVVVNPVPTVPALVPGLGLRIKPKNSNTGKTMIAVQGYPDTEIVRLDGSFLFDSDLIAGSVHEIIYDGAKFRLQNTGAAPQLLRPVNLYVNKAIGNDANDGSANDAEHALKSIQAAVDRAFAYGPSDQYGVTINIADGHYDKVWIVAPNGPNLAIIGNLANPSAVLVDGTSAAFSVMGNVSVSVSGILAQGGVGFFAANQAYLVVTKCETGPIHGSGSAMQAYQGARIDVEDHQFSGNCHFMYLAHWGGRIVITGGQTITTLIALGGACAAADSCGMIVSSATFTGVDNITAGKRYNVTMNGVIFAGQNGFPGASDGTTASGGVYA